MAFKYKSTIMSYMLPSTQHSPRWKASSPDCSFSGLNSGQGKQFPVITKDTVPIGVALIQRDIYQ